MTKDRNKRIRGYKTGNGVILPTVCVVAGIMAAARPICAQEKQPVDGAESKSTYSAETSYSGESRISIGNRSLGDVETFHQSFNFLHSWQYSEHFAFDLGAAVQRFNFDAPENSIVPDRLGSVALRIGETWKISDRWTARVEAQPGIYSDFEDLNGSDFNAPLGIGLSYSHSPNLQLIGGLSVNVRSKHPVFGGIGVRWKFADDWTLLLGAPRTRVEYNASAKLFAFVGADFKGGTFRMAKDFGSLAGRPDLNDQDVDYREIRVGGGARYKFNEYVSLEGEAGWMVDRRFEFHDRDLLLNGNGAPYIRMSVGGRF